MELKEERWTERKGKKQRWEKESEKNKNSERRQERGKRLFSEKCLKDNKGVIFYEKCKNF